MPEMFTRRQSVDVEFAIVEEPRDPAFPRYPNVVSHRTHVVRIIVKPRVLPDGTDFVTLIAHVVAHGADTIGQSEDTFRRARVWGFAEKADIPVSSPLIFIDVPRLPEDDHLGQGPYDAYVTVIPRDPEEPLDAEGGEAAAAEGGQEASAEGEAASSSSPAIADVGSIPVITDMTFRISFTSM